VNRSGKRRLGRAAALALSAFVLFGQDARALTITSPDQDYTITEPIAPPSPTPVNITAKSVTATDFVLNDSHLIQTLGSDVNTSDAPVSITADTITVSNNYAKSTSALEPWHPLILAHGDTTLTAKEITVDNNQSAGVFYALRATLSVSADTISAKGNGGDPYITYAVFSNPQGVDGGLTITARELISDGNMRLIYGSTVTVSADHITIKNNYNKYGGGGDHRR